MAPTKAQQVEAKLKAQTVRYDRWKKERDIKRNRDKDDGSLDEISAVSQNNLPKELQGHNAFDKS